mmetsp:Transcript_27363/g.84817  ORF Transcript_27363/g.84817 Transcript_27363/m.84817 type:complete len:261 (-) Transcript_27363:177-959(-)
MASSIRSFRFVMPMRSTLFSRFTPSIFDSSWLTTLSATPVESRTAPRCLQMASNSSKMIRCSEERSPLAACSASAAAKSFRTFSSAWPTYLLKISGPLTIVGSRQLRISPIFRAMSVFPVPGGPKSSMPFTWWMPSFFTTDCGKMRDAKARRNTCPNSARRPPMPSFSRLKSLTMAGCVASCTASGMLWSSISQRSTVSMRSLVSGRSTADAASLPPLPTPWVDTTLATYFMPSRTTRICCPSRKYCPLYWLWKRSWNAL